jgi:glutamate synthase domain-containing protein 2
VRDADGNLSDDKLREVAAIPQVRMFEIKLAQGAKPGKGGILPGAKVDAEVARIRGIPVGQPSISPNRHTDISNNEELIDAINHIRDVTGKPVGFKTVMGDFDALADFFDRVLKRGVEYAPDFITIDGGDGGTGAAPMPLMDLVGLPLRESLPRVSDILHERSLRDRVRLIASGKMVNPSDVAWCLALGADFIVSARGFMFSLGCIQSLKCNKNTCPTGITTHDRRFQKGLVPKVKADKVANFAMGVIHEVETIAHSVGVSAPRLIRRPHVRIVQASGRSISMDKLHARPEVMTD